MRDERDNDYGEKKQKLLNKRLEKGKPLAECLLIMAQGDAEIARTFARGMRLEDGVIRAIDAFHKEEKDAERAGAEKAAE